jgi:hypothetical protein
MQRAVAMKNIAKMLHFLGCSGTARGVNPILPSLCVMKNNSSLSVAASRQSLRQIFLVTLLFANLLSWGLAPIQAAPQYNIQVGLGTLSVGEPLSYEGMIVILRPSPGDNFWYRLPHRVEVVGELPPGIELVQKGAGFHDLARFEGTPTRAGTYTVQVSATMADGLKTNSITATFFIEDPKQREYSVQTWGAERLLAGVEIGNAGLQVSSPYRVLRAATKVNISGLPEGVELIFHGDGYYMLTGTPMTAGTYPTSVEFRWPDDNALIASSQFTVQVLPDDESARNYQLTLISLWPLRQGVRYSDNGYQAPWFYVEDQFGRRSEGPFTCEASGLPEGMSFSEQGFLVGRPQQAGNFEISLQVTLPNGAKTNTQSLSLQVRPSLTLEQYAGVYDCNIERSETLNGNMGGRLRFNITAGGQISGFLVHQGRRFPFASSAVKFDEGADQWVISPPNSGLQLSGNFDEQRDYSVAENSPFIRFAGQASAGEDEVGLAGWRATARSAASPSPYASAQPVNILFVPRDEAGQQGDFGGAGFMSMTVSVAGNATITVWAADGSAPVSLATTLTESSIGAFIPVYALPSNSSGSSALMGELFLNTDGDAAGQLTWQQRASNRGAFPEGIELISYEGVIGSRHVTQPQGLNLMGLEQSIADAQLDLMGDEVPSGSEASLSLRSSQILAVPAEQQVSQVKLKYNARSGMVTGSMVLRQSSGKRGRSVTFRGMRAPDGKSILGHYTVPEAANMKRSSAGMMKISAKAR